ncbi:MAG: hypothetical protein CVU95_16390 [Firmicutes bacterium HGW-Firmicutes-2]|nr:MAG: hypothetical protein CVU95_16390 [Firmicutes bacterium HGW-Firmicutes-2]
MDVAKSIFQGLAESIEYEKGDITKGNRHVVEIADLPHFHGGQIKEIRTKKKLSQAAFARALGVAVPSGPVQRILSMINQDQEILEKSKILIVK